MSSDPSYIGRYKILEELGQGAMGVVYLAEDPLLKRSVAIKVIHGGTATQAEALKRFQTEAEISASLNHPNVISIFDVGQQPGMGPFLAMEYIQGRSLFDRMNEGPLGGEESMLLLIQAMQALDAAHARGIVHRDFKPGNLMITNDGRLKLMDFGIARETRQDQTTELICTPSFAAPELLDRKAPSAATDRWAFAITAFRMITGELPFQAPSLTALVKLIDGEDPQFPESCSVPLRTVFLKALAKKPKDRYSDLRSFLKALLDALELPEEARTRCLALLAAGDMGTLLVPSVAKQRWPHYLRPSYPRLALFAAGIIALVVLGFWGFPRIFVRHLSVQSFPAGAQAFVDDKPVGITPIPDVKVRRDAHVLRLERKGYQTLEHAIGPEDHVLMLNLMPEAFRLYLKSDPMGSEVLLDGVLMGITPVEGLEVSGGGSHRLMVRKAGYETWSASISRDHRPPSQVRLKKLEEKKPFWKRLFGH